METRCNQCQAEVDVNTWKFCPSCGNSLSDEKIRYFIRKIFLSRRNLAVFLAVDVIILGTVFGLYIRSSYSLARKNQEMERILAQKKDVSVQVSAPEKILPIIYTKKHARLIELKVNSPVYGKLIVEAGIEGITERGVWDVNITPSSSVFYFTPEITREGSAKLAQSLKSEVSVVVDQIMENGEPKRLLDEKKPIFFYSRNEIAWSYNGIDESKFVTRLVDKDRDEIKELVRKSADHMKAAGSGADAMIGYQASKKEINEQIKAIFLAMKKDYEIKYVAAPFSYDSPEHQIVKSPEEVIKTKSGLCVELSLLMAAAMENIGLSPVLVITENHAWAGAEVSPQSDEFVFIETTALDQSPDQAVSIAKKNWDGVKNNPDAYRIIRFSEARADGLLPMRY